MNRIRTHRPLGEVFFREDSEGGARKTGSIKYSKGV